MFVILSLLLGGGSVRDVVANVLNSDILVNKFDFQLCYYAHFRANSPLESYEVGRLRDK